MRTPHFQRLARLKQLGASNFVYPSANHTRFEHCLGVAHLARVLVQSVKRRQPELEIDERDERLVVLAAQCHDLGHGVSSHAFETWVHERYPELDWSHERMGIVLLRDAVRKGLVPCLTNDPDGIDRIEAFILGLCKRSDVPERVLPASKRWMLDIVSNSRSGIDVDRMDYLKRDALHVLGGEKGIVNVDRILQNARVFGDGDRLCFHAKTMDSLYEMFHQRWSMFRTVYSHDATVNIEVMLQDAFTLLDGPLDIRACLTDATRYLALSDDIFQVARWKLAAASTSPAPTDVRLLARACALLDRIERRRLYHLIAKRVLDSSTWRRATRRKLTTTVEALAEIDPWLASHLDSLVLHVFQFHYGRKEKDPLQEAHFYRWGDAEPHPVLARDVTRMLPRQFSEYCLRLFCRTDDHEVQRRARDAFMQWLDGISPSKRSSASPSSPLHLSNEPELPESPSTFHRTVVCSSNATTTTTTIDGGDSSCQSGGHVTKRRRRNARHVWTTFANEDDTRSTADNITATTTTTTSDYNGNNDDDGSGSGNDGCAQVLWGSVSDKTCPDSMKPNSGEAAQ